jgi:L-fucose mutarotase
MLKGISPALSPELLATLHRMGHGDELILTDAHFPAHSLHAQVLRADGVGVAALLDGILPLFDLDTYVPDPLVMMAPVPGDLLDPAVEERYLAVVRRHAPALARVARIDRFAFYERARHAFAVVVTGETAKYGNVLLKKGVTPVG